MSHTLNHIDPYTVTFWPNGIYTINPFNQDTSHQFFQASRHFRHSSNEMHLQNLHDTRLCSPKGCLMAGYWHSSHGQREREGIYGLLCHGKRRNDPIVGEDISVMDVPDSYYVWDVGGELAKCQRLRMQSCETGITDAKAISVTRRSACLSWPTDKITSIALVPDSYLGVRCNMPLFASSMDCSQYIAMRSFGCK